jgi:hypothetical protein
MMLHNAGIYFSLASPRHVVHLIRVGVIRVVRRVRIEQDRGFAGPKPVRLADKLVLRRTFTVLRVKLGFFE